MAKKHRSAKQKANDRRLGAMARARHHKKSHPKRRKTNKPKRRSTNRTMPRKSRGFRRKGAIAGQAIKKGAIGGASGLATELVLTKMGASSLAVDAGYVVATLTGGKPGVIGNAVGRQVVKRFGGGLGFLNGGNGNGAGATDGMA